MLEVRKGNVKEANAKVQITTKYIQCDAQDRKVAKKCSVKNAKMLTSIKCYVKLQQHFCTKIL